MTVNSPAVPFYGSKDRVIGIAVPAIFLVLISFRPISTALTSACTAVYGHPVYALFATTFISMMMLSWAAVAIVWPLNHEVTVIQTYGIKVEMEEPDFNIWFNTVLVAGLTTLCTSVQSLMTFGFVLASVL